MSLEKTMNEYRTKFYNTYYKEISPLIVGFEEKRRQYLFKVYIYELLAILFLVGIILVFTDGWINSQVLLIFSIIDIVSMVFILMNFNDKFRKELKNYCMNPILKIFGRIQWSPTQINDNDLNKSELFASYNRRGCDDGFKGEYKGVTFEISETNLAFESGSGKNRTYRQIFQGVVIKFKSNKNIKNKTIITTKGDKNIKRTSYLTLLLSCIPIIINCFLSMDINYFLIVVSAIALIFFIASFFEKKYEKLKPIKLEDPVFAKKFNVYSADEIESRYLITTAFMERFINLNTAFGSKNAKCSFYDNNIMFAISTKRNLFELGNLFSNLNNPKQMDIFFNEIASILMLVEHFRLDQRIGL